MFDLESLAAWDRVLADGPMAPPDARAAAPSACPATGARPAAGTAPMTGRCPFFHGATAAAEGRA